MHLTIECHNTKKYEEGEMPVTTKEFRKWAYGLPAKVVDKEGG